ncbi:MAG: hypothetical protein L3J06_04680 [Cyclobacteriaceae bacterium]|nr:hypothetical protein [Cyclobacteriaceae bacterium]
MGRPSTKPKKLKDGFYIEVRNKGAKSGLKIRRETEAQMLFAKKGYDKTKDVIIIGEVKNGKPVKKIKKDA